jgi:hypothetical protein
MIGHKSRDCKNKFRQNGGQNGGYQVNSNNGAYCTYCRRPGNSKINYFKLKTKITVTVRQVSIKIKSSKTLTPMMLCLQPLSYYSSNI